MLDPRSRPRDLRTIHLCKTSHLPQTWGAGVAKDSSTSGYQWLHDIADAAAPAVRRAFLKAIDEIRGSVKEKELIEAIEQRNVDRVIATLGLEKSVPAALNKEFRSTLEDAFVKSGRAAVEETLPQGVGVSLRFDLVNPASQNFLRQYDFGLIRQVSNETRNAVREVVLNAFSFGGHPYEQARTIRDMIGLTVNQAKAVENYRGALVAEERPPDQIDRMVAKYNKRMLRLRAETISRTETIRAANAGQQATWQQAANQNLLNRSTVRRQWIVALDDRLCPECALVPLLNPTGVALDGFFNTPFGPVEYPPLHPNCRCTMILSAF